MEIFGTHRPKQLKTFDGTTYYYTADALSRIEEKAELNTLYSSQWLDWDLFEQEITSDCSLEEIIQKLKKGKSYGHYTLIQDELFHKGRIVLQATFSCIPKLLEEFHATPTGGHSGTFRTYKRLSSNLHWPGKLKMVQKFVSECLACQKHKYETLSPAGLLQPPPISSKVWEDIVMYFITGLPTSFGAGALLVVIRQIL